MISIGRGCTLLLGGARSGKSDLAVKFGQAWDGPVTFIATAEAGDDDMAARIERHKADRPTDWTLVEAPLLRAGDIVDADPKALVIVDCITLLVANLLGADKTKAQIDHHASVLSHALISRPTPTIIVSNEVGLGVHPTTELGRTYRGVMGRYNKHLAERAETTLFVAAGRVTPLLPLSIDW